MALSTVNSNNRGIVFRNEVVREFVRGDMFRKYKSEDANALIRVMMLKGKFGGDQVNVPIIGTLTGRGVGSGPLRGNEEKIDNYGYRAYIDWWRDAIVATKAEIKRGSFDLFAQAAPLLAERAKTIQRDETVLAALAIPSEQAPTGLGSEIGQRVNGILWSESTAAQRNAWLLQNADRVLFGQLRSNTVSGNVASSMANITAANGKMSAKTVRVIKGMAKKTSPRVSPVTTDDGYERYVLFVGSNAYRDAFADPEIYAANKDARPREGGTYKNNPIFNDGDLLYGGVVIREVPEIDVLHTQLGAGNGGTPGVSGAANIAPIFLFGQNAITWLVAEEMEPTRLADDDYQFLKGAGIEMAYGCGKTARKTLDGRLVDVGMVTGFVNSADDA